MVLGGEMVMYKVAGGEVSLWEILEHLHVT